MVARGCFGNGSVSGGGRRPVRGAAVSHNAVMNDVLTYLQIQLATFDEVPFNAVDSALLAQFCMARGEGIMPQVYRAQVSGEARPRRCVRAMGLWASCAVCSAVCGGVWANVQVNAQACGPRRRARTFEPTIRWPAPRVLALRGRKRRVWRRSRSFLRRRGGTEPK